MKFYTCLKKDYYLLILIALDNKPDNLKLFNQPIYIYNIVFICKMSKSKEA
jgi:hypothetical protein